MSVALSWAIRALVTVVLVGAALSVTAYPVRAVPSAHLDLDPAAGPAGSAVSATVDCGSPSDIGWTVSVSVPKADPTIFDIPPEGQAGTTGITIPNLPPGRFTVDAECAAGELWLPASADFVVEEPPKASVRLRPDEAERGAEIQLVGDALPACPEDGWSARIAGIEVAPTVLVISEAIDGSARYGGTFAVVVPPDAPLGRTAVELFCVDPVAGATLEVLPARGPTPGPTGGPTPGPTPGPTVVPTTPPPTSPQTPPPPPPPPPPPAPPPAPPPGVGWAVALGAVVLGSLAGWRQLRTREARDWAGRHVQVVLRTEGVRRW